jgi:hypothetical protein
LLVRGFAGYTGVLIFDLLIDDDDDGFLTVIYRYLLVVDGRWLVMMLIL